MRIYGTNHTELCVWKTDDKFTLQITEEDISGDVENVLDVEIDKEQAIKLANHILKISK